MAFPTSPINGQTATVNGITYVYASASRSWTVVQGNVASLYVTTFVSAGGNVTSGNLLTGGLISSTGNITSAANIAGGNLLGTTTVSAASHIGSVVSVTANVTGGNILTGGLISSTGNITSAANISGANIVATGTGKVFGYELTSTQSAGDEGGQINLSIPATNTALTGSVTIDVYQNQLRFFQGNGARGAYIDLTAAAAGVGSNLLAGGGGGGTPGGSNTFVQFNDGGTFGGNGQFVYNKVTNIVTAGAFAGNTNGTGQNFQVGDDAWIGDINQADTIGLKGQQNPANCYIVFGNSDATGKLGRAGTGPLTYAGAFSATGNINGGNLISAGTITTAGNIVSSASNGTANIGSATTYFNTVHAKATSAQYADVAEYYASDANYEPGTVLMFGGNKEVTICNTPNDTRVAGVVSTNPAHLMNAGIEATHSIALALIGRVPTKVLGPVSQGSLMVSAANGYAQACTTPQPGTVIGKAIENFQGISGTIEILVGRA